MNDWDEFLGGALNAGSLGFLYSPKRAPKTVDGNRARALRLALMQRLGQRMGDSPEQVPEFGDGFVQGAMMGLGRRR
jgi:hypothetical protein